MGNTQTSEQLAYLQSQHARNQQQILDSSSMRNKRSLSTPINPTQSLLLLAQNPQLTHEQTIKAPVLQSKYKQQHVQNHQNNEHFPEDEMNKPLQENTQEQNQYLYMQPYSYQHQQPQQSKPPVVFQKTRSATCFTQSMLPNILPIQNINMNNPHNNYNPSQTFSHPTCNQTITYDEFNPLSQPSNNIITAQQLIPHKPHQQQSHQLKNQYQHQPYQLTQSPNFTNPILMSHHSKETAHFSEVKENIVPPKLASTNSTASATKLKEKLISQQQQQQRPTLHNPTPSKILLKQSSQILQQISTNSHKKIIPQQQPQNQKQSHSTIDHIKSIQSIISDTATPTQSSEYVYSKEKGRRTFSQIPAANFDQQQQPQQIHQDSLSFIKQDLSNQEISKSQIQQQQERLQNQQNSFKKPPASSASCISANSASLSTKRIANTNITTTNLQQSNNSHSDLESVSRKLKYSNFIPTTSTISTSALLKQQNNYVTPSAYQIDQSKRTTVESSPIDRLQAIIQDTKFTAQLNQETDTSQTQTLQQQQQMHVRSNSASGLKIPNSFTRKNQLFSQKESHSPLPAPKLDTSEVFQQEKNEIDHQHYSIADLDNVRISSTFTAVAPESHQSEKHLQQKTTSSLIQSQPQHYLHQQDSKLTQQQQQLNQLKQSQLPSSPKEEELEGSKQLQSNHVRRFTLKIDCVKKVITQCGEKEANFSFEPDTQLSKNQQSQPQSSNVNYPPVRVSQSFKQQSEPLQGQAAWTPSKKSNALEPEHEFRRSLLVSPPTIASSDAKSDKASIKTSQIKIYHDKFEHIKISSQSLEKPAHDLILYKLDEELNALIPVLLDTTPTATHRFNQFKQTEKNPLDFQDDNSNNRNLTVISTLPTQNDISTDSFNSKLQQKHDLPAHKKSHSLLGTQANARILTDHSNIDNNNNTYLPTELEATSTEIKNPSVMSSCSSTYGTKNNNNQTQAVGYKQIHQKKQLLHSRSGSTSNPSTSLINISKITSNQRGSLYKPNFMIQ